MAHGSLNNTSRQILNISLEGVSQRVLCYLFPVLKQSRCSHTFKGYVEMATTVT
jgi:hypothetical protein